MIALIPARAGSKRCPGKNTRLLAGHPLIAYTIAAADASNCFTDILICSDDRAVLDIAAPWGCTLVPREAVSDAQPDIEWVRSALNVCPGENFAILRPTSPFRTAATIRRAYEQFQALPDRADSLRAIEPVKQHPGKMWLVIPRGSGEMFPVLPGVTNGVQNHSCPTQILQAYYVQNSSLEMAKRRCVDIFHSISGYVVHPFFTEECEGFAIDTEDDWQTAQRLVSYGPSKYLPVIGAPVA